MLGRVRGILVFAAVVEARQELNCRREESTMSNLWQPEDWHREARRHLEKSVYDYYAGGSGEESCLGRNESAFARWKIPYRVLVDVAEVDLSVRVAGQQLAHPFIVAPTAMHQMAHPEGEVATAKGAAASQTVMTLSTLSNLAMETVAEVAGPKWFQLYVHKDRGLTKELVERAKASGYGALVLTVDTPVLGRRWRDIRNSFEIPADKGLGNLAGAYAKACTQYGSGLAKYVAKNLDASLTWKDIEWLKSLSDLPLILKGIVRGDDARLAVESGASAIVVSNHGGRNLDSSPASVDVLPQVVEAVAGQVDVLMDGGVRGGEDAFKALCLGAKAVMIGRPVLWALTVGGAQGVEQLMGYYCSDLRVTMQLAGVRQISAMGQSFLSS